MAAPERIGYLRAMRQFSKNARLYLAYSTLSGVNNAIFVVAFVFYLAEVFRPGGSVPLLGAALAVPVYIGAVLGVQALAHGGNALPAGVLADKYGRKRSFFAASLCAIVAYALVLLTTNPFALILLAAIVGIGESFHGVVGGPFLMENSEPRERMHLFSLSASLESVSAIFGAILGGALPVVFMGAGMVRVDALRLALFASLPFAVAELVPLAFMREAKAPSALPFRDVLRMRHVRHRATVVKLFLLSTFLAFGVGLYFPLLNLHFEDSFHVHEAEFGPVIALNSLAVAVAILAAPMIVRRFGKLQAITYSRLAAVPFLVALAFVSAENLLWLATLLFVLRGAFAVMASPVAGALSMELVDAPERATTAGFTHAGFDLFYAGGIFLSGVLFASGGFWSGFLLAGLAYVGHAILWTVWFRGHPAALIVAEPVAAGAS